jgi:hypothetical protein
MASFDHQPEGREGGERLLLLQSMRSPSGQCRIQGLNEPALRTLFRGLREEVQTELACRNDNLSFDTLIAMAILLDNLFCERRYSNRFSPSLGEHFGSGPKPIEVGVTRFPAVAQHRWVQLGVCLYCGQGGLQQCPVRPNSGSTRAKGRSCHLPPPWAGVSIPSSSLSVKPFVVSITLVDCPSCFYSVSGFQCRLDLF